MNQPLRFRYQPLVYCIALAWLPWIQQAQAQEVDDRLPSVVVSMKRPSEKIQDVPMAITALRGDVLDAITTGGHDIRLLSGRAPSLSVESSLGRSFPRFYLRGQGNADFDLNAAQPVGVVMDDIVQESPILKGFPIFDVEHVEVLRGPQGTLFGRNAPAGVIRFDSVLPVLGKSMGHVSLTLAGDKAIHGEAVANLPLSATTAARLSLQSQNRDDRVHNPAPGALTSDFEGYHDHAARFQLLYGPHRQFSALFNVHARDLRASAVLFRANILRQGSNRLVEDFDYDTYLSDGGNEQWLRSHGASARLRWTFQDLTLHAISGYETAEFYSRGDIDGGYGCNIYCQVPGSGPGRIPFSVETADLLPDHGQFTQEVRIESSASAPVQWTAGGFYFNEHLKIDSISFDSLSAGNPVNPDFARQTQDARAYALFGSLNAAVSAQLKLSAGLRHTHDKKQFSAARLHTGLGITAGPFPFNASSSNTDGDVGLVYALDQDTNIYVRAATGYRAPAFQGRLNSNADRPSEAGPERTFSFEGGIKKELFGGRARLAAGLFRYTVKDKQLTAGSGVVDINRLVSADRVLGRGAEIDLEANLSRAWRLTAGGSYNHTRIDDAGLFVRTCGNEANTRLAGESRGLGCTVIGAAGPIAGTQLLDGKPLPKAPRWQSNATLRYRVSARGGEAYALTDWAYRSSYNMFLYDALEYRARPLLEGGLRLGYRWGRYDVSAFARNITNEIQAVGAIDFVNLAGIVNEPRTLGVQLKASF